MFTVIGVFSAFHLCLLGFHSYCLRKSPVGEARRLFKEIDIDGSGFISPDEILGQTDTPAVQLGLDFLDFFTTKLPGGNPLMNFSALYVGNRNYNPI